MNVMCTQQQWGLFPDKPKGMFYFHVKVSVKKFIFWSLLVRTQLPIQATWNHLYFDLQQNQR